MTLVWGETSFTYDGTEKVPTATVTDTVNGDELTVSVTGAQTDAGTGYTLSGAYQATNAGSYTATATLAGGYKWSDDSTTPKQIADSYGRMRTCSTSRSKC